VTVCIRWTVLHCVSKKLEQTWNTAVVLSRHLVSSQLNTDVFFDIRDRRSSLSPLCWHHNTAGAVDLSRYPWWTRLFGGCSVGMEQSATTDLACSSLLTYQRETKSHLFRQSYGWLGAVHSDRQQTSALSSATVLGIDFVNCPHNCVVAAL